MNDLVELICCSQCGQQKPASRTTPNWCQECVNAYNSRYSHIRSSNPGWMEVAKDSSLELWERQPHETQLEWSIWQAYRDSYPGAKPSYKKTAAIVGTTHDFVKKTAVRWDFQVRMQAWIAECDAMTLAQRRREVLDMNKEHIDMAKRLRDKMSTAIDNIDPYELKPSDLNSLLKTATELEKKARVDSIATEALARSEVAGVDAEDPNLKQSPTQQGDLKEVLGILLAAGALDDVALGVRKTETTTTEVVVKHE